jgi:hypothetical protein
VRMVEFARSHGDVPMQALSPKTIEVCYYLSST